MSRLKVMCGTGAAGGGGEADALQSQPMENGPPGPPYSPKVIEHFERPRNVGEVEHADASAQVENPACGDILELSLRVAGGRIAEARYRTRGCVAAIACGSALTEMLHGLSPSEARALRREDLVEAVGGLSNESTHASYLAMDALKAALKQILR